MKQANTFVTEMNFVLVEMWLSFEHDVGVKILTWGCLLLFVETVCFNFLFSAVARLPVSAGARCWGECNSAHEVPIKMENES